MLGDDGNGPVISELCHKGTVLQRNDKKMTMNHSFVKFHGKNI